MKAYREPELLRYAILCWTVDRPIDSRSCIGHFTEARQCPGSTG